MFVSMYHQAADRYGAVEHVELQLDHGGRMIMRVPWARCSNVDADDLASGSDPDANAMFGFLWGCAELAAQGLPTYTWENTIIERLRPSVHL